jgi:squalene-hopene/tetraprenyl-beta-curcumene cyclase
MRRSGIGVAALASVAVFALLGLLVVPTGAKTSDPPSWDPKAAAAYLDGRAAWWIAWPNAARDHDTFCVSCHTAVPYALARPALRDALGERDRTPAEVKLLDNVVKRVTLWKDLAPFYSDQMQGIPKTSESRGTEAILNALILTNRDAATGRLTDETRTALGNMWALQMKAKELAGAWAWLNFHYEPWESGGGSYFGAALAARAVGAAPEGYAASPQIQENIKLLRDYFQREYEHQPLFNRLMVLWASTSPAGTTGLLEPEQRQSIIEEALGKQQQDGGWSTVSLGAWKRLDGSEPDAQSDGYATGLVTLVLQQAGVSTPSPRVNKGLDWLRRNQDHATGRWPATSLNKQRDPASDAGRFMSDAATAFAVLSLAHVR